MEKGKFTQGRWYLQEFTDAYTNIIRCDNGRGFETLYIANLTGKGVDNRANAQFISAAPDMYKALQNSLNMLEQNLLYREANGITMGNTILISAIDEAKAALKKAVGMK